MLRLDPARRLQQRVPSGPFGQRPPKLVWFDYFYCRGRGVFGFRVRFAPAALTSILFLREGNLTGVSAESPEGQPMPWQRRYEAEKTCLGCRFVAEVLFVKDT
jgi:hypothetical protein